MKHAILGAGAIGGLIGTVLSSLGEDVTVVVRPQKLAEYPANLTLERPSGAITAPTKTVATLAEPVEVLWIATKAYQLGCPLFCARCRSKTITLSSNVRERVPRIHPFEMRRELGELPKGTLFA